MNADFSKVSLTAAEVECGLKDWVVERHPLASKEWRSIHSYNKRKMFGKLVKFKLRGLMPNLPRLANYRDKAFINQQYTKTWTEQAWPNLREPLTPKLRTATSWGEEGLLLRRGATARLHNLLLAKLIEAVKPKSVLEIGSGAGINLFTLSTRFPNVSFTGLELTQAGVDRSTAVTKLEALPQDLIDFVPWPVRSSTAFRNIKFIQGSATDLPFADKSFDLVYSNTALEQMENFRDKALREFRRVSKSVVGMIEPFGDFNQDSIRPMAIRAKNYLTLNSAELHPLGLKPVHVWSDWPRKLVVGYGLIVTVKSE